MLQEARTVILTTLGNLTNLGSELSTVMQQLALRDKQPSEISTAAMAEVGDMTALEGPARAQHAARERSMPPHCLASRPQIMSKLDKYKRPVLENLPKVKESLHK